MALMEAEGFERWPEAQGQAWDEETIDREHLARMTFGDRGLQREVLQLFVRQSAMLVGRMDPSRPRSVAALSHTLQGSAAGLGANRLARLASNVESIARTAPEELPAAIASLGQALEETSAAVMEILDSLRT